MSNSQAVKTLQTRLKIPVDGVFGPETRAAMLAAMVNVHAPATTIGDYHNAADTLGCSIAQIRAFAHVESNGSGYFSDGRPAILYEPQIFSELTGGRFDTSSPHLSYPRQGEYPYPKPSLRYDQLAMAAALDLIAAFEACSWGKFQILGNNAVSIGYTDAVAMAFLMVQSEIEQLGAFVRFIEANHLQRDLTRAKANDPQSCIPIARAYNGPAYAKFEYNVRLAAAIALYS